MATKKQLFYQNLPIPQNVDNLPAYLNNELQVIGNVIADINENTGSVTIENTVDTTEIEKKIDTNTTDIIALQREMDKIDESIVGLSEDVIANTNSIDDLQSYVVKFNNDIANDNVISQNEKSTLFKDWKTVYTEFVGLIAEANTYTTVDSTNYLLAFNALKSYLTADPFFLPAIPKDGTEWCANATPFQIDGKRYRNLWVEYYFQKTLLMNSFAGAATIIAQSSSDSAAAASYTAESAAYDAATALAEITAIASDNVLAQGEKNAIFIDWKNVFQEYPKILAKAASYSVSATAYTSAYSNLALYLTAPPISIETPPNTGDAWCSNPTSIAIDGTEFRNYWAVYFAALTDITTAITQATKDIADAAKVAADQAALDAAAAETNAASAIAGINDVLSDSILSGNERPTIFIDWKSIYNERADIAAKGTYYGLSTVNYNNAYNALYNLLVNSPYSIQNPPTDGVAWNAITTPITISNPQAFRDSFTNYYNERQLLLNSISVEAGKTATWSSITGTGKPADNANKTVVYRQTTAPTGGTYTTGDLWHDTDSLTGDFYSWDGSTWAKVANTIINTNQITDGAGLGTTAVWSTVSGRPTSLSGINATEGSKLSGIADSATKNTIYQQASAPTSGMNINDLWVKTGVSPSEFYTYNGSWVLTSTVGATSTQISNIATAATTATWSGVTGTGKPADFATKNSIYQQTSAPTSGMNVNDMWVKTGVSPAEFYTYNGANWILTSTVGATSTQVSLIDDRLSKSTRNILSAQGGLSVGTLQWNGSGIYSSGYGLGFSANGITAYNTSGVNTFALSTTGDATFRGNLTGSTGTFTGALQVGTNPLQTSGPTMSGTGAIFNSGGTFAIGNSTTNIAFDGSTMKLNGNVVGTANIQANAVSSYWSVGTAPYQQMPTAGSGLVVTTNQLTMPTAGTLVVQVLGVVHNNSTATSYRIQGYPNYTQRNSGGSVIGTGTWNPQFWKNVDAGGSLASSFGTYTSGTNGSMESFNSLYSITVSANDTVELKFNAAVASNQTVLYLDFVQFVAVLYKR
jgi:hypothetical protein